MFGLGFTEIAIILVVALLVLGPSKLPELARGLGKGLREFRKATEDFKSTIDGELYKPDPPRPNARPEVGAATDAVVVPALPAVAAPPGMPVPTLDPTRTAAPAPVTASPLESPGLAPIASAASTPPAEPAPASSDDKLPH